MKYNKDCPIANHAIHAMQTQGLQVARAVCRCQPEVPETFAERVQAIEAKIASLRADADKLEQMLVDLYKDPSK